MSLSSKLAASPYMPSPNPDSNLFLRKYQELIRQRKHKLSALRSADLSAEELKGLIFDIRQTTLELIEEGLELEYLNSQNVVVKNGKLKRLLPLLRYSPSKVFEDQSNCYVFNDIIWDAEDIFHLPQIKAILAGNPNFPKKRNPFFLNQSIDQLTSSTAAPLTLGVNALEHMRYRRCADALIKAEIQVLNKMPLSIHDTEHIWKVRTSSSDVDTLIRCVHTILINETRTDFDDQCLLPLSRHIPLLVSSAEFLKRLNEYKGTTLMLTNVEAAVLHEFGAVDWKAISEEPAIRFLVTWLQSALRVPASVSAAGPSAESASLAQVVWTKGSAEPGQVKSAQTKGKSGVPSSGSGGGASMGRIRAEIDKSVRLQVTKALKDAASAKETHATEVVENLRYEMVKLQQELLKRKVLNPLHYKAVSVDVASIDKKMSADAKHGSRLSTITSLPVKWPGGADGLAEFCLDGIAEVLIIRFIKHDGGEHSERDIVAYTKVGKLEFNLVTGAVLDEFLAMPLKRKLLVLKPLFSRVEHMLATVTPLEGCVYLELERVLHKASIAVSGVAVDIDMARNVEGTGILIHCKPQLVTSIAHTLLTICVLDKELLVLLIGQRSLLAFAHSKWTVMQMVCVWLSNRLIVKKTIVSGQGDRGEASELLQMTLDRSVEIPDVVMAAWIGRCVPHIGCSFTMSARQDLELLRITIAIDSSASSEESKEPKDNRYFKLELMHNMTGSELLVFGHVEALQDCGRATIGSHIDVMHPASFMWNIFSRIVVEFQSADDLLDRRSLSKESNWKIVFDRRLFRDIRTISGIVLIVTVTIVGSDIVFEGVPTQNADVKCVEQKVFSEEEISEVALSEGWPLGLLQYSERFHLAHRLLDKLKVVHENGAARLEPQFYAERRMLTISLRGGMHAHVVDSILGDVEIHEHITLTDLRTIIKHELDEAHVPRAYRFMFRGSPCSFRQEPYRRAWDCLPICILQVRNVTPIVNDEDEENASSDKTSKEQRSNAATPKKKSDKDAVVTDVPRYLVPLLTLGHIREASTSLYLLHDLSASLQAGDVIKIGSIASQEYTVVAIDRKSISIYPGFQLSEGASKIEFLCGNCPYVHKSFKHLLPAFDRLGAHYEIPDEVPVKTVEPVALTLDLYMRDEHKPEAETSVSADLQGAFTYEDAWLWVYTSEADARPMWRKEYDNGHVPYKYVFKKSHKMFHFFRIKIAYSFIEGLCVDARCPSLSVYASRADQVSSVPLDRFANIVFKKMCDWYPHSEHGIDSSKWLKLLRETEVFSDLKKPFRQSQIDIMYKAEARGPNGYSDKFVNYTGFCQLLRKLAVIRYASEVESVKPKTADSKSESRVSTSKSTRSAAAVAEAEEEAYSKLIMLNIASSTSWLEPVWEDAKLVAMAEVAKRYCAATRIAAFYRGAHLRYYYSIYIFCMISLQANIRRKLTQRRHREFLAYLRDDWIFRHRIRCAVLIQSVLRMFVVRRRFFRTMEMLSAQHMIYLRAKQQRLKIEKLHNAKALMYMRLRNVNRHTLVVKISRSDWRNFKNLSVVISVYVLGSQHTYKFELSTDTFRAYMATELNVSAVTVGDLLDKRNLDSLMKSRLIVRESLRDGKKVPKVILSSHGLGQQGNRCRVGGLRIGGHAFVVTLYSTVSAYTASCYHVDSCTVLNTTVTVTEVAKWVASELKPLAPIDEFEESDLLKPSNCKQLYKFLLENLLLDLRKKSFKILFRCQYERIRKWDYAVLIQRVLRGHRGRRAALQLILKQLIRVRDIPSGLYYYLNRATGTSSWEKPSVLRRIDLPVENKWMDYQFMGPAGVIVHYVNPARGVYTHLSTTHAARIVQSLYRNHMLKIHRLSVADIARVRKVITQAKSNYDKDSKKLMNVVNFALVSFIIDSNELLARVLIAQALELVDSSPLVLRAHGLFLLSVCEAPVMVNRDRAIDMFELSSKRDPTVLKFELAYQMLKYALYTNPRKSQFLLSIALAEHFIYHEKMRAEVYLRRALILDSFNERLVENWKYFKDIYTEKKNLYHPPAAYEKANTTKGSKKTLMHGRTVLEDPSWAGWSYVERDGNGIGENVEPYWYNSYTGECSWGAPDFQREWRKRLLRSKFEGMKYGLESYFDTYTSAYFQYHPLTDTYQ